MKSIRTFAIALTVVMLAVGTSAAATTEGAAGDGKASFAYDSATGNFTLQTDGVSVGLYDLQSASSIFNATLAPPPNPGLGLNVDTAARKSWAALSAQAITANHNLGNIAASGLTKAFLLGDLTITTSGGFGTANVIGDLVYLGGTSGVAPVVTDAPAGIRGTAGIVFSHQFATSAGTPPITWEGLTKVTGPTAPNAPTLSGAGLFQWNAAQAPVGMYSWDVTARNATGTDVGRINIEVIIPEPATISLFGLMAIGLVGLFRRRR
jgi:hypothetical protein